MYEGCHSRTLIRFFLQNSCVNWMFQCNNRRCIPYWWKCDQINDCGDNSDELGCVYTPSTTILPHTPTSPSTGTCETGEFQCSPSKSCWWLAWNNGLHKASLIFKLPIILLDECIPYSWVCDGMEDCNHGEDEKECGTVAPIHCPASEFRCRRSGICIPFSQRCDGVKQCADGSDEDFCVKTSAGTTRK